MCRWVSNGKSCIQVSVMKIVKECDAVTTQAMVYPKQQMVSLSCNDTSTGGMCTYLQRLQVQQHKMILPSVTVLNSLYYSRRHSVYPYTGVSHLPASEQTRRWSPIRIKSWLHSKVILVPGTKRKLLLRPNRGVSRMPHDITKKHSRICDVALVEVDIILCPLQ